jgi:hypothetical protein
MQSPLKVPLQELVLLTPEECERVHDDVHALRDRWIQRRPGLPFFTLGVASYLDAVNGNFANYRERARQLNPILKEHFGFLYERLCERLSAELGMPVRLDDDLAFPGFHIFLAHPEFTKPIASVHYDMQFQLIDWSAYGAVDTDRQLSLTLAIRMPRAGSGLQVWDINQLALRELSKEERTVKARENKVGRYHRYEPGAVVVHSGYQLHQIAPAKEMVEDDERLTLQAHAVPTEREWILYW